MTLNQIAQQAMDYLDSVGVAADYSIIELSRCNALRINTDIDFHICFEYEIPFLINRLSLMYPQKSPA